MRNGGESRVVEPSRGHLFERNCERPRLCRRVRPGSPVHPREARMIGGAQAPPGLIVKNLDILGDKGSRKAEVLFDSGARSSVVRKDVAEAVATLHTMKKPKVFGLARKGALMECRQSTVFDIRIGKKLVDGRFYVVENLSREVVVGADFLQNWSITLVPKEEEIILGGDPDNIELF
jgi:hypothetical protein